MSRRIPLRELVLYALRDGPLTLSEISEAVGKPVRSICNTDCLYKLRDLGLVKICGAGHGKTPANPVVEMLPGAQPLDLSSAHVWRREDKDEDEELAARMRANRERQRLDALVQEAKEAGVPVVAIVDPVLHAMMRRAA